MYWIPGIFIVLDFLVICVLPDVIRMASLKELAKRYKDKNLDAEINKFSNLAVNWMENFVVIVYLLEFIYFIIGFFYAIWIYSSIYIGMVVFNKILSSIKKEVPTEKLIKYANLKGFNAADVKFSRLLKIYELENKVKDYYLKPYLYSAIKIIAFASIIILHYNFKLI